MITRMIIREKKKRTEQTGTKEIKVKFLANIRNYFMITCQYGQKKTKKRNKARSRKINGKKQMKII